jgi:large repetitive protein
MLVRARPRVGSVSPVFAALLCWAGIAQAVTVTRTADPPGLVSVDNATVSLPSIIFPAGDFPAGALITDVNVSILWTKTDGSCEAQAAGSAFHNETSFVIQGPGSNQTLAGTGTWNGSVDIGLVTTVFDQAAAFIPSGTPVSGTFRPTTGNLSSYNGQPGGSTWTLQAGDSAPGDPLCVDSYSVTVTAEVPLDADLVMALTDAPDPVTAGGATNLVYSATLTNNGPADAQNARFSLPIPAGTVFVSATPSAGGACTNVSPITCTWAGATAAAGVRSATITVSIPAATPAGPISATATATSDTTDPTAANNTASTTTTIETSADLSMALTDAPDPVTAGGATNLVYTATLTNGGPSDAQNARFSLPLPAGTVFVSATPSAGGACTNVSPITCTWAGATAPMGVRSATITVSIPAATPAGPISATATATSDTTDPAVGNNAASTTTTVAVSADLSMALTDAPDPVTAGAGVNLVYTATLTNGGPSDAQNARFSLPIPAGTVLVSATPSAGGACTAVSPITCTWAGATAPMGVRSATISVSIPAATPAGPISATATATSDTADGTPGNNTASTTTTIETSADLTMALTDSPDPVVAGTQLTYTATVSNGGPSDAQNVSFALPLAAGTSFVSATPSAGGTCTNVSPVTCTWAGATTPMGNRSATIVVLVAANVANGTNLSATATASSATTDPNAANNAATATTAVIAQADIAMTAFTDSPDPVTAGTNLTYQVAMINNGASDAQNARFSLPLPTGTSFVSAAPSAGGNCTNVSPVTCTWAGATAPTVSRSATIVVLVAPSVLQGTTLNATVTGSSDTTDPVAGNNTLATSTAVIALADLQIGLTASVPTADLGQTVTFTATSTNGGPSDAQNVVLSITLSPDFRYGSHTASAGAVCTTPQIGNSGVISCTWAGATAPGVVRTLAVNAASFSPGTSSIQAATSSNTTDPVPTSNNVASVSVLVGNPVEPIPTLSQWSLMLLGLLVGLIGVALVRRD